jgi:YbbR domain-containing protein
MILLVKKNIVPYGGDGQVNPMEKKPGSTIGLKIISIIMAILLWFFVINQGELGVRQNSIQAELKYSGLPAGLTVIGPQTVQVKLWGAFKETGNVQAYVNLSGLSQGEYSLPVNVQPVKGAMFTSVQPKKVKVTLKEIGNNIVPIKYEVRQNPPEGYSLLKVIITPEKCLIRGGQSAISRVSSVEAPLELGNVKDISSFKVKLVPRDIKGNIITTGITLVPQTVDVYAVVEKKKSSRQLSIKPQFTGKIAEGYQIVQVTASPDIASVLGDENTIKMLDQINTDKIDITDKKESFEQMVNIVTPQGTAVVPSQVTVKVIVSKIGETSP